MNGWQKFCWGFAGLLMMGLAMGAQAQTTVEYVHTDALGSPVAVTNAAGAVIERTDYEPYGSMIGKPNYSGVGFTGHVQDGETGLTYMQQRYYDPILGRFLSIDPVMAYSMPVASFNRYWYAGNNPYAFVDPDGRQSARRTSIGSVCGDAVHYCEAGSFSSDETVPRPRDVNAPPSPPRPPQSLGKKMGDLAEDAWDEFWNKALPGMMPGEAQVAGLGKATFTALAGLRFARTANGFGGLLHASRYGVQPFNQLKAVLGKGTGLQVHHLIEQRFASVVGQNSRQMASIVVTPAEHQAFTNAWRAAIPYGPNGTGVATQQQVMQAARQIYSNYPAIQKALGL